MRNGLILAAALTASALAGCSGLGLGGGETPSPAPLAAPQAAAGGSPASTAPSGAALGGLLGGPLGASLGEADRQAAWEALIAALESGQRHAWKGSRGVYGFVEAGAEQGGGCRAYSQTVYVGGRPQRGQGVGCRQPDGGWKMTN